MSRRKKHSTPMQHITLRVDKRAAAAFARECRARYGLTGSEVLRECMQALLERRLHISPPSPDTAYQFENDPPLTDHGEHQHELDFT